MKLRAARINILRGKRMVPTEFWRRPRTRRNLLWLAVLTTIAWWPAYRSWSTLKETVTEVTARWEGNSLRLSSTRSGIVITHLVSRSGGREAVARLPEPVVLLDGGGCSFGEHTLRALSWKRGNGADAPPPLQGSPVEGFYYRSQRIKWHGRLDR